MRPAGLFCYICGREYFSKSLAIHVPQCKEKWIKAEKLKPKNERRAVPEPPMDLERAMKNGEIDKDKYNEMAFNNYNEKALIPCEKCGRTFLPDSLKWHLKGCKGE